MRTPVCELPGMEQPIGQAAVGTAAVPGWRARRIQPAADIVAELVRPGGSG